MALNITVTSLPHAGDGGDAYTVEIGREKISTVVTERTSKLSQWLKLLLTSSPKAKLSETILVGFSAERIPGADNDSCFDLLSLCVDSHCLLYVFPAVASDASVKSLNAFFGNPRVIVAAFDAVTLTKSLETLHGIKLKNAIDVRDIVHGKSHGLHESNLGEVVVAVLGTHMSVERPKAEIPWYAPNYSLADERIKFSAVDSYLCFEIVFKTRKKISKRPLWVDLKRHRRRRRTSPTVPIWVKAMACFVFSLIILLRSHGLFSVF